MPASRGRSFAASLVGWVLVALVLYFVFGWFISTILWIIRLVMVVVVLGALLAIYLKLRGDD